MHTLGSIPMVTPVLHAGDAFIGLSGLDLEPESDEKLFALFVIPGLPVFSLLNDGTPILLEDSVQRMRLENTQTPNTPWEPCAQSMVSAESCEEHSPTASRSVAINDLCRLLVSKGKVKHLTPHTARIFIMDKKGLRDDRSVPPNIPVP